MARARQIGLFYVMLLWLGMMLLMGNVAVLPVLLTPRWFREPLVQGLISHVFRVFLAGSQRCGLMQLDLNQLDALNHHKGLVLVANHPSMIDVFLVISRVRRAACLMKASIGSNILSVSYTHLTRTISNQLILFDF